VIPLRTLRSAMVAVVLTGTAALAAFPAPASAAPAAGHVTALRSLAPVLPREAAHGVASLTLGNGTRVDVTAPWATPNGSAGPVSRARVFSATASGVFCFFGAAQKYGPQSGPASPKAPKYTLTIKGTNLSGAPDTGDGVQVFSATSMTWNENTIGPAPVFRNGIDTMRVPAGKYWLIGQFSSGHSFRMDIPAQVTVAGRQHHRIGQCARGQQRGDRRDPAPGRAGRRGV